MNILKNDMPVAFSEQFMLSDSLVQYTSMGDISYFMIFKSQYKNLVETSFLGKLSFFCVNDVMIIKVINYDIK